MSVVRFPGSGLTERDFKALRNEVARRLGRGRPGYVTRGVSETGDMWAAILDRPGGYPMQHFCREQGVYYVLDFTGPGAGRLVDASRRFDEVLKRLPERSPRFT
ncbi:MAG: hypothetical protein OEM93_02260 [Rhodospirillales bacterium]|nr:hypothetical protein [Rhodospirillales bacterium]MDH3791164.1 hypothetical protein [Rhodospirillales bacterium]MDH3916538.1 hypothetical protein [Rhodospirillales bacterium]MDH3966087.1 hypothetical protein [Rhodospirillales bacterium]